MIKVFIIGDSKGRALGEHVVNEVRSKTWLIVMIVSVTMILVGYNACGPSKVIERVGADRTGGEVGSGSNSGSVESSQSGGGVDNDREYQVYHEGLHKILSKLPQGEAQRQLLCKRGPKDKVRNLFCISGTPPKITNLAELLDGVGLSFKNPASRPGFALLGHSSSFIMPEVSAINPRAIIFSPADLFSPTAPDYVAIGYARGLQFVELAAGDPNNSANLTFYLLTYTQDCNSAGRCRPGDLLTSQTELNWRSVSLYDDEDLKNTIFDCRQCHQPDGITGRRTLRMQELEVPWSHWMQKNFEGAEALLKDFHAAHGDQEEYAGIPATLIDFSNPPGLESLIRSLLQNNLQPIKYDSSKIAAEVKVSSPKQPNSNEVPGKSASWNVIYELFVAGKVAQIPYHDEKVTDTVKLNKAISNYRALIDGKIEANQLIDIRNVFPNDENILAEMGLFLKPGLTPQQMLMNGCAQCHNSKLDQTISRAKFDVNLAKMTVASKKEAIRRIKLAKDDPEVMPPPLFRTLRPDEIKQLTEFFAK